jgi:hypothetical protein
MKDTKIISAFPGVGKSWLFEHYKGTDKIVLDCDSSKFSWLSEGVRNPDFPHNYIAHIKANIGKFDYILVSSHKEVCRVMNDNLINYILVYPHESLIREYIQRLVKRGSDKKLIEFIRRNWFSFINELKEEDCRLKIELLQGQYLSDIICRQPNTAGIHW